MSSRSSHRPHRDCEHAACQQPSARREAFANQAERQRDPTRTKTARRRFAQHLRGRWDAIKSHIYQGIVKNDAFGLQGGGPSTLEADVARPGEPYAGHVDKDDDLTPGAGQFDFPSSSRAAEEFSDWLDEVLDAELLEEYDGDRYVRKGYGRGIKHAQARLREQGIDVPEDELGMIFRAPVHRDKLQLLYERAFEELQGITQAAAQEMRRELTEGLSQGKNPREIARNINDRVEKVGKTRSTVLARTEVVRAHSEGTLGRFERIAGDGVQVEVQAEWSTAGDSRVCEICEGLEGRTFSLDEARGMLPIHPQCRCAWLPRVPDESAS